MTNDIFNDAHPPMSLKTLTPLSIICEIPPISIRLYGVSFCRDRLMVTLFNKAQNKNKSLPGDGMLSVLIFFRGGGVNMALVGFTVTRGGENET